MSHLLLLSKWTQRIPTVPSNTEIRSLSQWAGWNIGRRRNLNLRYRDPSRGREAGCLVEVQELSGAERLRRRARSYLPVPPIHRDVQTSGGALHVLPDCPVGSREELVVSLGPGGLDRNSVRDWPSQSWWSHKALTLTGMLNCNLSIFLIYSIQPGATLANRKQTSILSEKLPRETNG